MSLRSAAAAHGVQATISAGWAYSRITTNATTLVKTGPGVFHGVTISTVGSGGNTISVYDGLTASGTLIAVIPGATLPSQITYDLAFATGLTVVTATGVAADIVVTYY